MSEQPQCPECEKLVKVSEESNQIGEFLLWLFANKGKICSYDEENGEWYPIQQPCIEIVLAEYFGINMDKVESERNALVNWIQNNQ